ncbi:MAG: hypothetical protein ACLFUQ_07415 [Candidatus Izemoplasmataceae bacterium]
MYELDVIKSTSLAKKMGGPPVFNDGYLKRITLDRSLTVLEMVILSDHNPSLKKDTVVNLVLHDVHAFNIESEKVDHGLFVINDLDIRREGTGLVMRLESSRGEMSTFHFESIELKD